MECANQNPATASLWRVLAPVCDTGRLEPRRTQRQVEPNPGSFCARRLSRFDTSRPSAPRTAGSATRPSSLIIEAVTGISMHALSTRSAFAYCKTLRKES